MVGDAPLQRRRGARRRRPGQALRAGPLRPHRRELHRVLRAAPGMTDGGDDLPIYITQFGYSVRGGRGPRPGPGRRARDLRDHGLRADDLPALRHGVLVVRASTRRRGTRRSSPCWTTRPDPTRPTPPSRTGVDGSRKCVSDAGQRGWPIPAKRPRRSDAGARLAGSVSVGRQVRRPPVQLPPVLSLIGARRPRDPKPCRCGHQRQAHEHYRRGTDCALCPCQRFRARRGRRRGPDESVRHPGRRR